MKSFMEVGPHVFPKSGTPTHRQTDGATLYIDLPLRLRVKNF